MNGILAGLVCGALVFVEQDIPGIRVGRVEPLSGERWRNFRQADIDGDGKTDLLLPDCVAFQRGDAFRTEDRAPLPYLEESPACDLWDTTLYFRLPARVACVKWSREGWETILDLPVPWPRQGVSSNGTGSQSNHAAPLVHFERFLHDLDEDGVPEIVVTSDQGVHVFVKNESGYVESGLLDVLPPPQLVPEQTPSFWPPDTRRTPSPELQLSCRFFIAKNRLVMLESDFLSNDTVHYHVRRYEILRKEDGSWTARLASEQQTPPMASSMRPCRLNEDDTIDFAGGNWQFEPGGVLHAPVYETLASTNGGHTTQFVRSMSFRPSCSFVDFNGDGRLDMVTESSGLFAGGVRETVTRLMSTHAFDHTVRIHLQNKNGAFPGSPDAEGTFRINIDKVPARSGDRFNRYSASELIDVTGDFDADGIRDAVVHGDARCIRVFRGTAKGFSSKPLIAAQIQGHWRFAADDVDGDGRSDLVFRWMDSASTDAYEQCRVFLTREKTQ